MEKIVRHMIFRTISLKNQGEKGFLSTVKVPSTTIPPDKSSIRKAYGLGQFEGQKSIHSGNS
jgi:hypothetical protein